MIGKTYADPRTGDRYRLIGVNADGTGRFEPIPIAPEADVGFLERARASFAGWSPEEQLGAWERMRPEQQARISQGGGVELLQGGQWAPVDPSGLDVGDIADVAGLVPYIGGALGASALTPVIAAGGVAGALGAFGSNVAMQGLGAGAAGLGRDLIARTLGVQDRTTGELARAIGEDVLMGAAGEGAFRVAAPALKATVGKALKGAYQASTGLTAREISALTDPKSKIAGYVDEALSGVNREGAGGTARGMIDSLDASIKASGKSDIQPFVERVDALLRSDVGAQAAAFDAVSGVRQALDSPAMIADLGREEARRLATRLDDIVGREGGTITSDVLADVRSMLDDAISGEAGIGKTSRAGASLTQIRQGLFGSADDAASGVLSGIEKRALGDEGFNALTTARRKWAQARADIRDVHAKLAAQTDAAANRLGKLSGGKLDATLEKLRGLATEYGDKKFAEELVDRARAETIAFKLDPGNTYGTSIQRFVYPAFAGAVLSGQLPLAAGLSAVGALTSKTGARRALGAVRGLRGLAEKTAPAAREGLARPAITVTDILHSSPSLTINQLTDPASAKAAMDKLLAGRTLEGLEQSQVRRLAQALADEGHLNVHVGESDRLTTDIPRRASLDTLRQALSNVGRDVSLVAKEAEQIARPAATAQSGRAIDRLESRAAKVSPEVKLYDALNPDVGVRRGLEDTLSNAGVPLIRNAKVANHLPIVADDAGRTNVVLSVDSAGNATIAEVKAAGRVQTVRDPAHPKVGAEPYADMAIPDLATSRTVPVGSLKGASEKAVSVLEKRVKQFSKPGRVSEEEAAQRARQAAFEEGRPTGVPESQIAEPAVPASEGDRLRGVLARLDGQGQVVSRRELAAEYRGITGETLPDWSRGDIQALRTTVRDAINTELSKTAGEAPLAAGEKVQREVVKGAAKPAKAGKVVKYTPEQVEAFKRTQGVLPVDDDAALQQWSKDIVEAQPVRGEIQGVVAAVAKESGLESSGDIARLELAATAAARLADDPIAAAEAAARQRAGQVKGGRAKAKKEPKSKSKRKAQDEPTLPLKDVPETVEEVQAVAQAMNETAESEGARIARELAEEVPDAASAAQVRDAIPEPLTPTSAGGGFVGKGTGQGVNRAAGGAGRGRVTVSEFNRTLNDMRGKFSGVEIESGELPQGVLAVTQGRKVTIDPAKFSDKEAIRRTIIHEVVGHIGLHRISGRRFSRLLDNVYKSIPEGEAAKIEADLVGQGYGHATVKTPEGRRELAEEWLARQAETASLDDVKLGFFSEIRRLVLGTFRTEVDNADVLMMLRRAHLTETGEYIKIPAKGIGAILAAIKEQGNAD